ncbi:MAG: transporter permease, partial [Microbacteriaceae bacterium]|nr:transporter permease [Microbacteriaceae bacterium]
MTTVTEQSGQAPGSTIVRETTVVRSLKTPIALAVFSVLAVVLFVILRRPGTSMFRLSTATDVIQLPPISVPSIATGIVLTVILVGITAASVVFYATYRKTPAWLTGVFGALFVIGFLAWAAATVTDPAAHSIYVPGLLIGTVGLSTALIFGALGGVISERAGVVNVAIEGQLLAGAFVSAVVASVTGQLLLGVIAAMIAGVLVSFVLAAFAIKYVVDQVIVGV